MPDTWLIMQANGIGKPDGTDATKGSLWWLMVNITGYADGSLVLVIY